MSIYRCFILTSSVILREFQNVKNKAYDKRFLNIVILFPSRIAAMLELSFVTARREYAENLFLTKANNRRFRYALFSLGLRIAAKVRKIIEKTTG